MGKKKPPKIGGMVPGTGTKQRAETVVNITFYKTRVTTA